MTVDWGRSRGVYIDGQMKSMWVSFSLAGKGLCWDSRVARCQFGNDKGGPLRIPGIALFFWAGF